jgi:hypothetical protein
VRSVRVVRLENERKFVSVCVGSEYMLFAEVSELVRDT